MKIRSFNHIAVFSAYIPPHTSGSGINAFNFATELSLRGLHVNLYSFNWFSSQGKQEVINNPSVARIKVLNRLIYRPYLFFWFIPIIIKHRYFIFFGTFPGYLLLILLAKIFRRKIIFRSTNLNSDDLVSLTNTHNYLKRTISKFLISQLDVYYSLGSEFTGRCLHVLPDFGNRIFESNQGVRIDRFFPDDELREKYRDSLFEREDGLIIISVGNLTKRKGYGRTFYALSQLKIPFHYLVAGKEKVDKTNFWQDSEEMLELYDLGNRGLKDRVLFTGFLEHYELVSYYQKADIFLLNSVDEGLPNALLESMACGLVPLVNDKSGVAASVVAGFDADLVFTDTEDLIRKVIHLYQNIKLREVLRVQSREFAIRNFDAKSIVNKLIYFCERENS